MNSKMTTNSQVLKTEPKQKQKQSKQLEYEQNHRNGDKMEHYQRGAGGEKRGKGTGDTWQVENRWGKVKNSIGY